MGFFGRFKIVTRFIFLGAAKGNDMDVVLALGVNERNHLTIKVGL